MEGNKLNGLNFSQEKGFNKHLDLLSLNTIWMTRLKPWRSQQSWKTKQGKTSSRHYLRNLIWQNVWWHEAPMSSLVRWSQTQWKKRPSLVRYAWQWKSQRNEFQTRNEFGSSSKASSAQQAWLNSKCSRQMVIRKIQLWFTRLRLLN